MARIDHGRMLYKAFKLGLIETSTSVQAGIRTNKPETLGSNIIDAREVHESESVATVANLKSILGARKTYLSFDIDCLDPAFAPGTGMPVWGGLRSDQAAINLREIAEINLVGKDVVEVSPPFEPAGITAVAGAHSALEFFCLWGRTQRG